MYLCTFFLPQTHSCNEENFCTLFLTKKILQQDCFCSINQTWQNSFVCWVLAVMTLTTFMYKNMGLTFRIYLCINLHVHVHREQCACNLVQHTYIVPGSIKPTISLYPGISLAKSLQVSKTKVSPDTKRLS